MALKPQLGKDTIEQIKRLALQLTGRSHTDEAIEDARTRLWQSQQDMQLLQGTQDYFPALIADIEAARLSVYFETYIFDTTGSAEAVALALMAAAKRGVAVNLVIDGIGSRSLSAEWRERLVQAGVQLRVFSPPGRWLLFVRQEWQRLHRKLCAVDGSIAYCGGINVLDDFHDPNHGQLEYPRLDFSVRVTGQLAAHIALTCHALWLKLEGKALVKQAAQNQGQGDEQGNSNEKFSEKINEKLAALLGLGRKPKQAALVLRDNLSQRRSIERSYLRAIARARQDVLIANAYFFPSRKLLKALRLAAGRGVRVRLLLQGRYEYFLQAHATRAFYSPLLRAGVELYEYEASFLHAKVAVIDAHTSKSWATVGSSNLDPLSLLLAREANVVSRQRQFAQELQAKLQEALAHGRPVALTDLQNRRWWERFFDKLAYGAARSMVWLVKDHF